MPWTREQIHLIQQAWLHFETVVATLPPSRNTHQLRLYARHMVDNLANPVPNLGYLRLITQRVNELVDANPRRAKIEDSVLRVNTVLDCLIL